MNKETTLYLVIGIAAVGCIFLMLKKAQPSAGQTPLQAAQGNLGAAWSEDSTNIDTSLAWLLQAPGEFGTWLGNETALWGTGQD
jgi:hypothetical protein